MCGICGVLTLDGQGMVHEEIIQQMVTSQAHRGPDDQGYHSEPGVNFGFCRLAIIDLSPAGHQPMTNEDGSVWIVFNGEIYNYRDVIPALERAGHTFRSRSDTEVIIHAYEEWGIDCLQHFNGMFAFAIFDRRKHRVLIARDRLGVKPLYYWSDGEQFAFGSELKSVIAFPRVPRELDHHALQSYLVYEYVPSPESIFQGIQKLPAAHWIEIPLDGSATGRKTNDWQPHSYWNVQYDTPDTLERPLDEYAEELRTLLREATRRRLISDVPLGAFLSGGIDSSAVVAMMAEVGTERPKTFSIGFAEQSYNELDFAQIVARKFDTDHHVEILNPNAHDLISAVTTYQDEPFADASSLPTYLVSQMARKHVTVALAGDAGDELFAGYNTYRAQRMAAQTVDRLPDSVRERLRGIAARIPPTAKKMGILNVTRRMLEGVSMPASMQHVRWQAFWQDEDLGHLLASPTPYFTDGVDPAILQLFAASGSHRPLDQQQYADIKRYLTDDILWKVDRMSMAVSLEARGPFLDYTLVEFAARLPVSLRLNGMTGKHLLKYAMRGILPDDILYRKKLGFNIPYKLWLRNELSDLLRDALAPTRLQQQGLFHVPYVQTLVNEHISGTRDHAHKLWQLLMFQLWFDRYNTGTHRATSPAMQGVYASS